MAKTLQSRITTLLSEQQRLEEKLNQLKKKRANEITQLAMQCGLDVIDNITLKTNFEKIVAHYHVQNHPTAVEKSSTPSAKDTSATQA